MVGLRNGEKHEFAAYGRIETDDWTLPPYGRLGSQLS
jgi:hypothetical protein